MITSHQLLDFVDKCTETEVTLDAQGDVLSTSPAVLDGQALAKAVQAIASLAVAEHDILLQNKSLELHHEKKDGDSEKADPNQGYM